MQRRIFEIISLLKGRYVAFKSLFFNDFNFMIYLIIIMFFDYQRNNIKKSNLFCVSIINYNIRLNRLSPCIFVVNYFKVASLH